MYLLTDGKIPLIGVGGIANGEQAYEKIKAGASLIQLYSAMVYRGPQIAYIIAKELAFLAKKDGFRNISAAIGSDYS
jgi:dihydroorotate dehydrogenase